MSTLWHGRFGGEPADELLTYTASLPFDQRLAPDDIAGSRAHVRELVRAGVLTEDEGPAVLEALEVTEAELAAGSFAFRASDEDIHTAVERRVTELAGAAGAKLHTGRSRNDQVATDLRLYTKRALAEVAGRVLDLQDVLFDRAEEAGDVYLPGYTHLQRAQPVGLAHHLLAHGWALARDVDRLLDCRRRADVSPLGAGALAGSSIPLDPDRVAADLGFAARFENSLDAVSDRDFVAEALCGLALVGIHLSRIGEEVVLWTSEEFGFASLDDAYATGSSMLPQKRNPDIAELARGKAGRLIGNLTGVLATLKGLPLAYNRDLQEDKEPLFDAVDQVSLGLSAVAGLLSTLRWDAARMQAAADSPYTAAIDLAEQLVVRGTPFRDAHAIVGGLVRDSIDRSVPLADLVGAHPSFLEADLTLLEPGVAVQRRTTPGGAGPAAVAVQRERFADRLHMDRGAGRRLLMARRRRLPRSFYARDARVVAPELLGKLLVRGTRSARVVEVEAYCGAEDPGSHAYRGPTPRNATMFGPPGRLYVYFTYGMHWCANAVCGQPGEGVAVLLRAAEPVTGLDEMRAHRPKARRDRDLLSGPARLCQAFGIDGTHNGLDLVRAGRGMTIVDDGTPPPDVPAVSTRIGLSRGMEHPWRWCTPGSLHLSKPA